MSCSRLRLPSTGPCLATPGLPGRRLSAPRGRPCQTTAFCRHSNTCCQLDAQQFWRQDLCRRRTTSLEQSAAQSQTMWAVIRPVQAVTEDIFIRTVRPQRSVNCFLTVPDRNITYLRPHISGVCVCAWVIMRCELLD